MADSIDKTNKSDIDHTPPDPAPGADPWFLPDPGESALTDLPWPVATREVNLDPQAWQVGEAAQYRGLLRAAEALARFGERLARFGDGIARFGDGMAGRFALASVSALLRGEGVWLGPERIALYQSLRIGADDDARDLARASWAMRRLGDPRSGGPLDGLHGFLGRKPVGGPGGAVSPPPPRAPPPHAEDRPLGDELESLGNHWIAAVGGMNDLHPLTRGAFAFAEWRRLGLSPFEEMLEPCVAAMRVGAAGGAPFLPLAQGQAIGRLAIGGSVEDRLSAFYAATESGALTALMDLDRLADWQTRAVQATGDLSGRTPPRLIAALLRLPVVSADLLAETLACSRAGARRNLGRFAERGLIREVTGQDRYRFWTAQL